MKKKDLSRSVSLEFPCERYSRISDALRKFEARIGGTRGAEDVRDRFYAGLRRIYVRPAPPTRLPHDLRLCAWKQRSALRLAAMAGRHYDEHGYRRGDYRTTTGIDYIPPHLSAAPPYCDSGNAGLGLIEIERTRIYARSSKWYPSKTSTRFLVGRNETGTHFAHPVPGACETVYEAVQWIWSNQANRIVQRQGDIALVWSAGPKMPARLPVGHRIVDHHVIHVTHPPLPLPGKGQRIIVGRRASETRAAAIATRD